jgi:hypothetical protein
MLIAGLGVFGIATVAAGLALTADMMLASRGVWFVSSEGRGQAVSV